jgi:hypothetical protein
MATNKELAEQVKDLKEIIRGLASEKKSFVAEEVELSDIGFGVTLDPESNKFSFVTLKFNAEKKSAIIEEVQELSSSVMEAVILAQKSIGKYVTDLNRSRK